MAIILIGVTGFAQKIPARPVPPRLVNDFANILSDKEEYALETKLVNYNDTTSTQICVVTVTSLDGTTSDDFAQKLGEKWGVGTKDNNGVVILVKPKTADELGDVSIQVGYGMEPYITDAVNYVIRTKEMIPAFKEGDYYTGIDNAVDAIIGLASGAFTAEEYADEDGDALGILVIFLAIMVVIVLISSSGKGKGGRRSSGFWNGFFLGSMFSGGGGSSWGSGGGSWGGGHGGGFGGFGGGHFGGGGGSSKW
ncbi:MAG: TPM domain-containing protein [Bacteroidales bacterium]|nr:TPM domain-containing protein [Bacteroidales bacterium]